ncbi:unnamed protein product [Rangifer tarandus platyrhynchus]|uniref:Uncharacterized protein n=2 Tax=Rangifer tarandus platyrhynchus TaxID=3082113 RepID=A0AC59ZCF6_RANTA|nr:unnamed protein product [Rangifer tarandus platyrhynchus]
MIPPSQGQDGVRWLGGFPDTPPPPHPVPSPERGWWGEFTWPSPASLNQPSPWAVCVSGFRSFFFFSWLKYFAEDQVIGERRGAGAAGDTTPSSPPRQVV